MNRNSVSTGTKTLREATSHVVNAITKKAGVDERHDVTHDGTPYATIDPDTVHVRDLPPDATAEDVAFHFYQKVHEIAHLVRRRDYEVFNDEYKDLRPPYRLDNLFIDGPVDHLYHGEYKGADGWRDTGRLHYQSQFMGDDVKPIAPDDRQAVVVTAAALVDCLVRNRTYPKSSRYLAVMLNRQGQGTVVSKLVKLAQDNGFIERFRELYLDAEANNLHDLLTTIEDMLKLWEPHLPTGSHGNPDGDGGEQGDTGGEQGGEQSGEQEGENGEQGDTDGEQGGDTGDQSQDDGDGDGQDESGSYGNPTVAESMMDEHEVKADKLDGEFHSELETGQHKQAFAERRPTDPSNTCYIPATGDMRWQYFLGRDKCISAEGAVRDEKLSELAFKAAHYIKTGECKDNCAGWREEQQRCVDEVVGKDAGLRKLQMYLNAKYQAGKLYGQRSGKLNKRMAHRIVTDVPDDKWRERVFTKRTAKPDPRGTAISLGIDISGSMARSVATPYGANRHHVAAGSVVKIARALDMLNMDYEVFGYTLDWGGGGVINIVYKEYSERVPTGTLSRRVTQFTPMGANADGESISMAGERLLSLPHERKVMIVLSDGEPRSAGGYTDAYDGGAYPECDYLKAVTENLTSQGVEMIGLGIDTPTVMNYYPYAREIQAENLSEQLIDVLKELL